VTNPTDPKWAWQPYRPSAEAPWDLRRVGHLYRRAAFGATWDELQRGLAAGPEAAVAALLKGGDDPAFDATTREMAASIGRANNGFQLRAFGVYRMLYSPHPLREKLTLFWHNHFATSNAKVNNAGWMLGQYELMRQHALGSFRPLVREMSKDPAMLRWLDTDRSEKGKPNENYARELMELFSLGIGNYTETDIREAARAFTGWRLENGTASFDRARHDDTPKTVFGRTGNFTGDDIVNLCLDKPVSATFLVGKLVRFYVSETLPLTPELLAPLAEQYRASDYDTGALVKTVLRSNLFHSDAAYRTRVKSPIEFAVGIVRGLEGRVGASPLALALEGLGQTVFYPPSVKGWDGGPAWLNGQTLLFRQNLALALTSTEDPRFNRRCDPAALARKHGRGGEAEAPDFFLHLFLQGDAPPEAKQQLTDYLARPAARPVYWTDQDAADHRLRAACHLALSFPEYQLA
jgi:uncharacterized protein (DUF1800 family)